MKLSEKGLKRLLDVAFDGNEFYQSNALQIEFEPDDFVGGCCQNGKGHIALTVEEASEILDYLSYLHLRGGRDSFLKDLEKCNRNLYERIEQAEKCNEVE